MSRSTISLLLLASLLPAVAAGEWIDEARERLRDGDPAAARALIAEARSRGDADAADLLAETADTTGDYNLRTAAVEALASLGGAGGADRIAAMLRDPDAPHRLPAIDAAARREDPPIREGLLLCLEDADWRVRAAAMEALAAQRWEEAVPALIDRLREERGRLRLDARKTLEAIAGERLGMSATPWQDWWNRRQGGNDEPPPEDPGEEPVLATTLSEFYDFEIHSKRILFLIDVSSSMRYEGRFEDREHIDINPRGDGPGTRMATAKEELRGAIEGLDEDVRFNILFFGDAVSRWKEEPVPVTPRNRRDALRAVDRQPAAVSRGTLMYEALRDALAQEVDTIYLLTDGLPEGGEIDTWGLMPGDTFNRMLREVSLWNSHRRVRIHCAALHVDGRPGHLWQVGASLLRAIAENTGGRYAPFND